MAVQPPVRSVAHAVSLITTSTCMPQRFHPHHPSIPTSTFPHLGEPPLCVCRSACLTFRWAGWLTADDEWGSHEVAFSSVAAAAITVSFNEEEIGESVLAVRVRVPCRRRFRSPLPLLIHLSPHFHFVVPVPPPSGAAASSVWAGRVRRARFFAV